MSKRAMLVANSASMIDHFNKDNIDILKSMGYDITVAANFKDGNSSTNERIAEFTEELKEQNIDIINLPIPRSISQFFNVFRSVSILKKYLTEHPCRLVHTQTPFGGVIGRLAAKRSRKISQTRVIYFVHGFHFFKGASFKNYLIYYNIEKYLSKFTDCLITLNSEDYSAASDRFSAAEVEYVPGVGVDTDYISSIVIDKTAMKKKLGIAVDNKVILTVAELIPRKNIVTAIKAFAALNDKNCTLLICGKGQLLDELKTLCISLGIEKKVIFAGYRKDILEICRLADIFLFTSFQEGLPVAIMQAMAAGLPVIASDIRGNRDLLENSGTGLNFNCLAAPEDVNAFVHKLNYLLDNPDICRELGNENISICRDNFDITIVHNQMKKIYNNLLNS